MPEPIDAGGWYRFDEMPPPREKAVWVHRPGGFPRGLGDILPNLPDTLMARLGRSGWWTVQPEHAMADGDATPITDVRHWAPLRDQNPPAGPTLELVFDRLNDYRLVGFGPEEGQTTIRPDGLAIRTTALALAIESHGPAAGVQEDRCFTARARHFEAYLRGQEP